MDEEMNEEMNEMKQQTQGVGSAGADGAAEHEDRDLVVAQGVFYRVLRENEAPFWVREDAEQHMRLLSFLLGIPSEPIEWFVPALTDESPRQLREHIAAELAHDPELAWTIFRSDVCCVPPHSDPVYFWRNRDVNGMASPVVGVPGIYLRADMCRSGFDGLTFVIAHEMRHRRQAHARAAGRYVGRCVEDLDRDANQFAEWYLTTFQLCSDGFCLVRSAAATPERATGVA